MYQLHQPSEKKFEASPHQDQYIMVVYNLVES
jgi:hypothetical protein